MPRIHASDHHPLVFLVLKLVRELHACVGILADGNHGNTRHRGVSLEVHGVQLHGDLGRGHSQAGQAVNDGLTDGFLILIAMATGSEENER
jgi:hypothetical protein